MISTFGILTSVLASDRGLHFADADLVVVDHGSLGRPLAELGAGFDVVHLTLALAVLALRFHLRALGTEIIITGTIGIRSQIIKVYFHFSVLPAAKSVRQTIRRPHAAS